MTGKTLSERLRAQRESPDECPVEDCLACQGADDVCVTVTRLDRLANAVIDAAWQAQENPDAGEALRPIDRAANALDAALRELEEAGQ